MSIEAMKQALEALETIALAGMSGSGQESPEAITEWHASQAWRFISIAAQQLEPLSQAIEQAEPKLPEYFHDQSGSLVRVYQRREDNTPLFGSQFGVHPPIPATDYAKLYEELRQAIDGGSESMTHKDALRAVGYWQERINALETHNTMLRDELETCINFGSGRSFNERAYLPPQVLDAARAALGVSL